MLNKPLPAHEVEEIKEHSECQMRSQECYIFLMISTWIKVEIKVPVPHPVILFVLILNYQYDYLFKTVRIVEIRELMEILIQDLIYFLNQYFPMGILFAF